MQLTRPCPLPRARGSLKFVAPLATGLGAVLLCATPVTAVAAPIVANQLNACTQTVVSSWDITLATCSSASTQDFTFTPVSSGSSISTIRNAAANLCIATQGTGSGAFVELGTCSSTAAGQRFQQVALSGALVQLKLASANVCLTAPTGVGAIAFSVTTCNTGEPRQAFRLSTATPPPPPAGPPSVSATFTQDTGSEIPNPDRGMYTWANGDFAQWDQATANSQAQAGFRVVLAFIRLDAYVNTDQLPASLMTQLSASFGYARKAGLKVIPRIVYNYPDGETDYRDAKDAPLNRVKLHLDALKNVLQQNADVISYVQAGLIGAWGEWHTSSNQLVNEERTLTTAVTQIRDKLLEVFPNRFIQVRYPDYILGWAAQNPSWLDGSSASRVGMHNDCFLASTTDVGTYSSDATTRNSQRAAIAARSGVTPFGGETCQGSDEFGSVPRDTCNDILTEGAQFHLTYLNNDYYREGFHDKWGASCLAQVKRRMGYRFDYVTLQHASELAVGQSGSFQLQVRNTGWARAYNPRRLDLVLRHRTSGNTVTVPLSAVDPRTWLPNSTTTVSTAFTIPAGTPTGVYDVALALPDAASATLLDATGKYVVAYSVRPANQNSGSQTWDAASGSFRTGTSITVR